MRSFILAAALAAAALAGCSQDDTYDATITELKGGCREVCPRCHPGEVCSRIACRIECHAKTQQAPADSVDCGPVLCASGQVCCNASCGICTDPGGACIQIVCEPQPTSCTIMALCIQGYVWSDTKCACVPSSTGGTSQCSSDADCAVGADYCSGGCGCVALGPGQSEPTCSDPVACFAYPCLGKTAVCLNGTCAVADGAIQ